MTDFETRRQGENRHCVVWPSGRHAWSHWRRAPPATRERSTGERRRVGRNGWICPQESPGSAHNEIEGPLVEIGPRSVLAIRRSVSGSSQRGRVVGGSGEWRVASGEWRVAGELWPVAREQWPVDSSQWPVNAKRGNWR